MLCSLRSVCIGWGVVHGHSGGGNRHAGWGLKRHHVARAALQLRRSVSPEVVRADARHILHRFSCETLRTLVGPLFVFLMSTMLFNLVWALHAASPFAAETFPGGTF